ncbi:MAG TPA: hypothetical protein VMS17_15120 [Gemmataceae bacterium]|nr:hypothetical protein [Gemmataceae bacterium]
MTLEEALLQKLAEWRFDNGPQTLALPHPESGWTAEVKAEHADRVGCQVEELKLTRTGAALTTDLKTRAERTAARVTGLLEPLRLIEVDAGRDAALLRSTAPQKRGDDLYYYEVELKTGGDAGVHRYQASTTGGMRQQIAFPLTHEALAKVAGDLTADV